MLRKIMIRCKSRFLLESGLYMVIVLMCIATAEAGKAYIVADNECAIDSSSSNNACSYLDSSSCTVMTNGVLPTYYCQGYSLPGQCNSSPGKNCRLALNTPCGTQMNCSNNSPVILSGGLTADCTGAPDTCTTQ